MTKECRETRQLTESFVSEQLLVETTHVVLAHLEGCAACRAEVDGLRRLRAATRDAVTRAADLRARPDFITDVRARLQSAAGRASRASAIRRWAAVAAMLVLLAGGGFGLRAWSALGFAAVLHAAAGDHQFCALTYRLIERPITLTEAARRFDPVYAALATVEPSSATLRGSPVRVLERHSCVYAGHRFAHIVLHYKGQAASVLVADHDMLKAWLGPGPGNGEGPVTLPATEGFHIAGFRASNRMVFVISSLDQSDVQELAQAMMAPIARAMAGA